MNSKKLKLNHCRLTYIRNKLMLLTDKLNKRTKITLLYQILFISFLNQIGILKYPV